MTDKMTTDVTDEERRLARKWAEDIVTCFGNARMQAAARVILDAVPAPAPPTLADMPGPERDACRWLQADVLNHDTCYVIADPHVDDGSAIMVAPSGRLVWFPAPWITPRHDLPRMEFPGDKKPEPAPSLPDGWRLAQHKRLGRVVVTNPTPNSGGEVYIAAPEENPLGRACRFCDPSELTYLSQGADTSDDVPESTLAVGSVWEDGDALTEAVRESGRDQIIVTHRDNNVSVWDRRREDWRILYPIQKYAPFTIVHAGKGGDQ